MKKVFLSVAALMMSVVVFAQPKVTVASIDKVAMPEGVEAATPVISPKGDFVVVQSDGALKRVDLSSGKVSKIADTPHAFSIKISPDGSQVAYLEADYKDKMRYVSVKNADIATGKVTQVVKPSRKVASGLAFNGNSLSAVENGKAQTKAFSKATKVAAPVAAINYGHLDITIDGVTRSIDPQGEGSYLWPSISPDGTKVVYWCVGEGCFVCNLDGSNPVSLGELRAAVWAGNDMVVGMLDRDNGVVVTSSVLLASDLKGEKIQLTPDNIISLEPSASVDGNKVAFVSDKGDLYIINLTR